jgi:hypothetical protein
MSHARVLGRRWQAALGADFLGGGPNSPRHDEDSMNMMVGASKSYCTSRREVGPISSLSVHLKESSPLSRSRIASAGGSCLDGPVRGPPSARRCFDRHSPTVDPVNRGATSRCREGVVRGGDEGGGELPPIPSPPCQRTRIWQGGGGDFCPPFPHRPTGGAMISLPLLTRPRGPIRGASRLPPCGIRGWISIPRFTRPPP